MKYYNLEDIKKCNAHYNIIIGERSNGKTTACLLEAINEYWEHGTRGAIIRRHQEDLRGKCQDFFNGINAMAAEDETLSVGRVAEITGGEYNAVEYNSRKHAFYLVRYEEDGKKVVSSDPFCFVFAITQAMHYKSVAYPNVGIIIFDEFLTPLNYVTDEVMLFLNIVSTIVREKAQATIYMVANTVAWNAPYFESFGLRDVYKMQPGDLATYTRSRKRKSDIIDTVIAVEYCENTQEYGGKASDVYFTISEDSAAMITDGAFDVGNYPSCPVRFSVNHVKATYWIQTREDFGKLMEDATVSPDENVGMLKARLIRVGHEMFVYVEQVCKGRFLMEYNEHRDFYYSLEYTSNPMHFTNPLKPYGMRATSYLASSVDNNRMFFDSGFSGVEFKYYCNKASQTNIMNI